VKNLSSIARQNAILSQHLAPLLPESRVHCLEFYFDDPDDPAFVLTDGILTSSSALISVEEEVIQIVGDNGFLYIQDGAEVPHNLIKNWKLPQISIDKLYVQLEALEDLIKRFKAIDIFRNSSLHKSLYR
jgi:hypothetical protein